MHRVERLHTLRRVELRLAGGIVKRSAERAEEGDEVLTVAARRRPEVESGLCELAAAALGQLLRGVLECGEVLRRVGGIEAGGLERALAIGDRLRAGDQRHAVDLVLVERG